MRAHRLSTPTITPRPVESRKSTPLRSITRWVRPEFAKPHDLLAQLGGSGDVELAGDGENGPVVAIGHREIEQHEILLVSPSGGYRSTERRTRVAAL